MSNKVWATFRQVKSLMETTIIVSLNGRRENAKRLLVISLNIVLLGIISL